MARHFWIEIGTLIGEKMIIPTFLMIEILKMCFFFMPASGAMHFRIIVLR